jgi:predicted dinucleotide-binding enzyme
MKIGIIGSGGFGALLVRKFSAAGHTVLISNSRGPETLKRSRRRDRSDSRDHCGRGEGR